MISESSLRRKRRFSKEFKKEKRTFYKNGVKVNRNDFKHHYIEKNDYYNTIETTRIENFMYTDPLYAKEYVENYIEQYPRDCYARCLYVQILIILKQMDMAKEKLKELEYIIDNDSTYKKFEHRVLNVNNKYFFTKLKYLLYSHSYQDAYDYILFNYDCYPNMGLDKVLRYIESILKFEGYECYDGEFYSLHQISHYSEDMMLSHIKKHMSEGNYFKDEPNSNIFVTDFPLEDVYDEIKNRYEPNSAIYGGLMEDIYFFKYDDCGKVENKYVDYIKVVCYHNTFNVITMLPVKEYPMGFCIDLNYLKDCKKKIKCD